MRSLLGNLGCRFFSFITLSMSCPSLLAWKVSVERSAVILMGIPFCSICCFYLDAFNLCSLCLIFINMINICLGVFCLGFILFGTLWVSWIWVAISFLILGKFSTIISSIFPQISAFSFPDSLFYSYNRGFPIPNRTFSVPLTSALICALSFPFLWVYFALFLVSQ